MSRRAQFGNSVPAPSVRYYQWSSNDAKFKYYDKEKGTNELVKSLEFVVLTSRSCVSGWDGDEDTGTNSQIYSNEVKNTMKEELRVYTSKPDKKNNTLIGTGLYRDLKSQNLPIHFERAIYAYEEGVGIIKINLKGSALMVLSTFEKENKKGMLDNVIVVKDSKKAKKGSVTYTTPTFELGKLVEGELDASVEEAFKVVETYLNSKNKSNDVEEDFSTESSEFDSPVVNGQEDDLPF